MAKFNRALAAAATVNAELSTLESEEAAACGSVARVSWHELDDETPITASRLETWRGYCRREGLMD